jgi:SAM-dependent methyltransferase
VVRHALGVADLTGCAPSTSAARRGSSPTSSPSPGRRRPWGVDIDEPGLAKARARFGERVDFRVARGEALPFDDDTMDIVVLNHIYEHVVDPEAVVADIHRVLRPGGVLYLGIGHRWQVIEPHHRLPFLSWLPRGAADRYMRLTGKGEHYYERYYTPAGLRRLFEDFDVWDYTVPVLSDRSAFAAGDNVPAWASRVPPAVFRAALPLVPTYVWAAFKGASTPSGPPCGWLPVTSAPESRRRPAPDAGAARVVRGWFAPPAPAARGGGLGVPPGWRRPHEPARP